VAWKGGVVSTPLPLRMSLAPCAAAAAAAQQARLLRPPRLLLLPQVRESPLYHVVNAQVLMATNRLDEARKVWDGGRG